MSLFSHALKRLSCHVNTANPNQLPISFSSATRTFSSISLHSTCPLSSRKPAHFKNDIPVPKNYEYQLSTEEVEEHWSESTWFVFLKRSAVIVLGFHASFYFYAKSQGVFDDQTSKVNH